jgi:flavin-dependent dehydrogenase
MAGEMERWDVIIVGSGPAGSAAALELAAREPSLAPRTLLLEKARHPRDKTCAGGVIPKAVRELAALGVSLDVPQARVDRAAVTVRDRQVAVAGDDLCRVVRRRELDALLAWTARNRGIVLREETRVVDLVRDGAGVRVETPTTTCWAPVVIGADGTGSVVRRALVPGGSGPVARAVMADIPVAATRWDGYGAQRYDFDFRSCTTGLRGYRWVFPCLIGGVPHANVGVYGLPPADGSRLRAELAAALDEIGAATPEWKAFPIRTFARGTAIAAPHALLAGDAAGIDALMGEGISFALEYGRAAAAAVLHARASGDWSMQSYTAAVHDGPIGRKLRLLALASRLFYGRTRALAFALAGVSARAQHRALRWYNGVDEAL